MTQLAELYKQGKGMSQSAAAAIALFECPASEGDPVAQSSGFLMSSVALARLYERKDGVSKDLSAAVKRLRRLRKLAIRMHNSH